MGKNCSTDHVQRAVVNRSHSRVKAAVLQGSVLARIYQWPGGDEGVHS